MARLLQHPWLLAFAAGIVCITAMRPLLRHEPAPPPVLSQLPEWALVDSSGASFGSADLAGRVWIASFFLTRCAAGCPALTRALASLQQRYRDSGIEDVRLVSISVDPGFDTPERLADYAELHGIDPTSWKLLTGDEQRVRDLVQRGFHTPVEHSERLVLVDRAGAIRGSYGSDASGLDEVFHRSRHVLAERR